MLYFLIEGEGSNMSHHLSDYSDHREEKQQYDSDYSLQNKNNSQSPSNSEYYPPSKIYQIVNNNLCIIYYESDSI